MIYYYVHNPYVEEESFLGFFQNCCAVFFDLGHSALYYFLLLVVSLIFRMANSKQQNQPILIAGGGPAGLLASILLSRIGVESIVVEKTIEPDTWSTKSYTLVLGNKGKGCLAEAGCLEEALASGNERRFIYFYDSKTGDVKAMPKQTTGLGEKRILPVGRLIQLRPVIFQTVFSELTSPRRQ